MHSLCTSSCLRNWSSSFWSLFYGRGVDFGKITHSFLPISASMPKKNTMVDVANNQYVLLYACWTLRCYNDNYSKTFGESLQISIRVSFKLMIYVHPWIAKLETKLTGMVRTLFLAALVVGPINYWKKIIVQVPDTYCLYNACSSR